MTVLAALQKIDFVVIIASNLAILVTCFETYRHTGRRPLLAMAVASAIDIVLEAAVTRERALPFVNRTTFSTAYAALLIVTNVLWGGGFVAMVLAFKRLSPPRSIHLDAGAEAPAGDG